MIIGKVHPFPIDPQISSIAQRLALEPSSSDIDSFTKWDEEFTEIARQVEFDAAHSSESFFAMAEYLTGVMVTPDLLEQSVYQCGVAPNSQ